MQYRVISAVNNNVVLVRDDAGDQMILMAKGIGFGRKPGDLVSDDAKGRQIFKLWPEDAPLRAVPDDHAAVARAVDDILRLARERLQVKNPNLGPALTDHIQFAVDRLRFGLPIDNPFVQETALLYPLEYEVAGEAVRIIKRHLDVNAGEPEAGFIALHLHSACEGDGMARSMRTVQLYKQIMEELEAARLGAQADRRAFLQWVFELIDMVRRGVALRFPFAKEHLAQLCESAAVAARVGALIEKSCRITLGDDAMSFLILEAEKLRQSSDNHA